jgi:hypothetical protein
MFEVQYGPGGEVVLRFRPKQLRLLSEEGRTHLKSAGRELLLAVRSVVDEALESIQEQKAPPKRRIEVKESKKQ